jgi:hypothetical protein
MELHSMDLFEDNNLYVSSIRLFYAYYKEVPSIKIIRNIHSLKMKNWMNFTYGDEIVTRHVRQYFNRKSKEMVDSNVIYVLKNKLVVAIQYNNAEVYFSNAHEAAAQRVIDDAKKYSIKEGETHAIYVVTNELSGLGLSELKIGKPKLVLKINYNDDLLPMHKYILRTLKKKNKSGLILFHGAPGTGKSTYIQYLIHCLNKKVIYLPTKLASSLDSPNIISLLVDNPYSIFVIEDAEELLVSRQGGSNPGISLLLNLTDGLLGESLGIQIIATFNTHISNIDKALLRKGRLIALYEFMELTAKKSKALLEKIKIHKYDVKNAMSLAEIYNIESEGFFYKAGGQSIGFINSGKTNF